MLYVDGGARGNPGPAAAAAVIGTPEGAVLEEVSELLGETSNNVAEYRALLLGLERARTIGASEVEIINDSELIARQLTGAYKVKHAALLPLHRQAVELLGSFRRWSIKSVPRAENARADALVNAALDGVVREAPA